MREQMTEEKLDEAYDDANELAMELLRTIGLIDDGEGGVVGNVSIGIAGAALGIAAGRLMAAASDYTFLNWMKSVAGERNRTLAEQFTRQ